MIIRCKNIIDLLSDLYEHQLEQELEEIVMEHIYECKRCLAMLHTFEKTLDLLHTIEPYVKLERKKKNDFHRWLRVEIQRITVKRYYKKF
ncbi:MAG: hypothetical protein ACK4WJ_02635 [Endomicrobiia bacterium]